MAEINADKLAEVLRQLPADQAAAYADLFAAGCYLHLQGHTDAGLKMCRTALKAIGEDQRKTYFDSLMRSVKGNEAALGKGASPHLEVSKLFDGHSGH